MPPDQTAGGALRAATHARHQAIEALLQLDQPLPLATYTRVLRGFESFLRQWEPHLRAALPADWRAGFDERSRLAMVQADLRTLHATPADGAARGWDLDLDLPRRLPLPSTAAALGSQYVLEGSALGGQVIARRLADTFGFTPAHGAAYFHGWGEATGGHWREFRERLAAHVPAAGPGCEAACTAACRTFDLLIDHFTQHLHEPAAAA